MHRLSTPERAARPGTAYRSCQKNNALPGADRGTHASIFPHSSTTPPVRIHLKSLPEEQRKDRESSPPDGRNTRRKTHSARRTHLPVARLLAQTAATTWGPGQSSQEPPFFSPE